MSVWIIVAVITPLWGEASDTLLSDRAYSTEKACRDVAALSNLRLPATKRSYYECREIKVIR